MKTKDVSTYKHLDFIDLIGLSNWSVKYLLEGEIEYNKDYSLVKIGDILSRNKTQIQVQDNEIYKRVTIKINNGGIFLRDTKKGIQIGTKKQFKISKNQFLLSKIDARNGAFGVVPEEVDEAIITGNFWTYDVDNTKVIPEFLSLITTTTQFIGFCQRSSAGTTNRHYLQENLFLNEKIPLPTLQEQKEILSAYRNKLNQAKQLIEDSKTLDNKLDESLGIKSIEGKRIVSGKLSFIDFEKIEQWGLDQIFKTVTKYDALYTVTTVKLLCNIGSGGTPRRSISRYYKGDIPWVKTGEVLDDIIYDTEEKITKEAVSNSSAKIYPKGSLLMAMYGQGKTRGRTAKLGIDATTNQACAVLYDIKNDLVLTDYLWVYLMNEYDRIRELASGNNQPNLNADMIKNYPVVLPPIPIQAEILDFFFKIKEEIKKNKKNASLLKEQSLIEFESTIFQTQE